MALCRWPGNIMHWQLTNRQWTHTMHWVNPRTTLDVVAKRISVISGITHWSARSQIVILLNELYKHTNSRKWQRDQQSSPFVDHKYIYCVNLKSKNKGVPRHAKVVQGVLGRLRPRIFLTFQHYKGQPNAPATFTPGEIPGTHFQRLSRPQGTWFCWGYHGKKP